MELGFLTPFSEDALNIANEGPFTCIEIGGSAGWMRKGQSRRTCSETSTRSASSALGRCVSSRASGPAWSLGWSHCALPRAAACKEEGEWRPLG